MRGVVFAERSVLHVCMKCGKQFRGYYVTCYQCGGKGCDKCHQTGVVTETLLCPKCYDGYRTFDNMMKRSRLVKRTNNGKRKKIKKQEKGDGYET